MRKERSVRYPRARWCSGRWRRGRGWGVGGWRRGGSHCQGKQSAAGEWNYELVWGGVKEGGMLLLWTIAARDKGTRGGGRMRGAWRRGGWPTAPAWGGGRWPRHRCVSARAWAGTCGYGLTWATSKRALPLILFLKFQNQHKFCNSIWWLFLCPKFTKFFIGIFGSTRNMFTF
jgi:hypothetical protein